MRLLTICLVLLGASSFALAQTNEPSKEVRRLALQECIQMALKHNLDLQIDRYNPEILLYTLKANYGVYDPTFSLSGEHDHNEAGSQILGGGFTIPGSVSDVDSFSSALNGLLPWGTTYAIGTGTPIKDTWGYTPSLFGTNNPFENSIGSVGVTVSQPLLKNFWMDINRLNIRVAKNRLKYGELTLKLQIMQTISNLEQAY